MTLQTVKVLRLCLKNELRLADGRQRCSRQTVGFRTNKRLYVRWQNFTGAARFRTHARYGKPCKKICEYKGEKIGIKEARKHAAWYIKGIKNAAEYRQSVGLLESIEQLEEIAYKISISN